RSTRYIALAPIAKPMTSPNEPRTASLYHAAPAARAPVVDPAIAAAIVTAAMATYLVMAAVVPRDLVLPAAQASLAAVPIAAMMIAQRGYRFAGLWRSLGFRRPRLRFFVAATAIGTTTWYLNTRLVD